MNDFVKIKQVRTKEALNECLNIGWKLICKLEEDQYEIGLPIDAAYRNAFELMSNFLTYTDSVDLLFKEWAKLYNVDLEDYEATHISNITYSLKKIAGKTHYIDRNDTFNKRINNHIALYPGFVGKLLAKPLKQDEQ